MYRLKAALDFCNTQKEIRLKPKTYFVGTISEEPFGFRRIEGYLFDTKPEANFEVLGRLQRTARILRLVIGSFSVKEVYSSKNRWQANPLKPQRLENSSVTGGFL